MKPQCHKFLDHHERGSTTPPFELLVLQDLVVMPKFCSSIFRDIPYRLLALEEGGDMPEGSFIPILSLSSVG